jgi:hypothetical protein
VAQTASGTHVGRGAAVALGFAVVWSGVLLVSAVTVPAYESETRSTGGEVVRDTATLVEVNGPWALVVVAAPLVATAVVAWALWSGGSRHGAVLAAWAAVGLLTALSVLALLSVGMFFLPTALALALACGLGTMGPSAAGSTAQAGAEGRRNHG